MLRALILAALICVYCGTLPSMAAQTFSVNRRPITITTNGIPPPPSSSSLATSKPDQVIDSNNSNQQQDEERYYHPAEDKKPRVLEEFNRNFKDGSYEYKFILSNGVTRYEKSYWKPMGLGEKLLARKGFYSHPLTNHKYLTVFYTADENGYQQDTSKYTNVVPTLPKHLQVPQLQFPQETIIITNPTTTTRKPTTTTRRTTTTTRRPTTTRRTTTTTTTRKPKTTTTRRPVVKPSEFSWIY
ncbi:integumentary mucin C.1-like [Lucilia sericata]|uniref:integumentary mucin C.1-like n=1 Tax=Lucilia sericata TaxID=13632 RepID=UPI0018A85538|nr:integumentary mucin C.1-like [Lucilia sericata]